MKKTNSIPVNPLAEKFDAGVAIGKISSNELPSFEEAVYAHRHDYHIFILVERGTAYIEIDFEKHKLEVSTALYIHPNQVHRIIKVEKAEFYLLGISNERLNARYLKLLEEIVPAKPLSLKNDIFSTIIQSISLCLTIFERKEGKLYPSLLNDCCNTLVGLVLSQYLELTLTNEKLSRFYMITKAFKLLLERSFTSIKRPSNYASALNISTVYLNECVRNATGFSVSYHIQQRIILEAKRLLHHSEKSVKEISSELGYDDYAYFSRLFSKVTGMTALAFRRKNID